jgi:hypothetical protein
LPKIKNTLSAGLAKMPGVEDLYESMHASLDPEYLNNTNHK